VSAFIFCRHCRSERVDVRETRPDGAQIFACSTCGQTEIVRSFTLGRCGYSEAGLLALPRLLDEARRDAVWERRPRMVVAGVERRSGGARVIQLRVAGGATDGGRS